MAENTTKHQMIDLLRDMKEGDNITIAISVFPDKETNPSKKLVVYTSGVREVRKDNAGQFTLFGRAYESPDVGKAKK